MDWKDTVFIQASKSKVEIYGGGCFDILVDDGVFEGQSRDP